MTANAHVKLTLLDFFPGLQHDQPDEERTGDEGADAGEQLEHPRPRQVVGVRVVAAHPVILALQTEGVVREDHDRHHQEHACKI